jgi:pyruvate,water dikinase
MPAPADPFVLPLDAPDATLERVGGKGASLAHLARAGLPVPPGFHVTTEAYRRVVAANDLQPRIEAASAEATPDAPSSLERAAERIAELFASARMPAEIADAIRAGYAELATDREPPAVAVRSSATAEDLPELSFAGQQESYLDVRGADAVVDAVRRCWASLWTARAIGYRRRNGIPDGEVSIGVVVQALIAAESAGVVFTVNPVTGAHETVINAAWGLGESVVGGLVTPDRVTADPTTGRFVAQEIGDKATRVVPTAGGTRVEPVPEAARRAPVLAPEQAAELARLAVRIEQLWGRPMDLEWAIGDGRAWILQARPITALPGRAAGEAAPPPGSLEWPFPDPRTKYYRASVVELLPDPVSPLFATLALPSWNAALAELVGSRTCRSGSRRSTATPTTRSGCTPRSSSGSSR